MGAPFGFKAIKLPGVQYAGEAEDVGNEVGAFHKREAVCGTKTGLRY